MSRPRLLVCTHEPLEGRLNGTAIRATELARATGAVLAAPRGGDAFFHPHDPRPLVELLRDADAVLTTPLWPRLVAAIRHSGVPWICDLYIPEPLETLEHFRDRPRLRRLMNALALDRLDDVIRDAALVLCASERQRDLWTGALLADRALRPDIYDGDPTLARRIAIVPFGVPDAPPRGAGALHAAFPDIDGPVVLWNGGTWPWLDPATAVSATLAQPNAHIVFMGGADDRVRPGPRVRINDRWVPYDERGAWLADADAVISTHHDHVETRYSFRTRIVDAFWAGVPVVCTDGDDLAARVEHDGLGVIAAPYDTAALAAGLAHVLARGRAAYSAPLAAAAESLHWSRVVQPLLEWLGAPAPAPCVARSAHPARKARTAAYRASRPLLDRVGLRDWPRV